MLKAFDKKINTGMENLKEKQSPKEGLPHNESESEKDSKILELFEKLKFANETIAKLVDS